MPKSKSKRCFIALPLDSSCRDDLIGALVEVDVPGLRRVPSENLHMTIKFLGDVEDAFLGQVIESMNAVMTDRKKFDLEVMAITWLPSEERARVLAAECQASASVSELAESIDVAMNDLGFPLEGRAFLPHITLGRFKQPPQCALPEIDLPRTGFAAEKIVLMESCLLPTGPEYNPLATWELK